MHKRMWIFLGFLMLLIPVVRAEAPDDDGADPQQAMRREYLAALQAMNAAKQAGPLDIPFLDQAVLHLPAGFAFVPSAESGRFMKSLGNAINDGFLGLIMPLAKNEEWVASLTFDKSGYIKDDDAKNWNVDELLANLKTGAEGVNRARAERGLPELDVLGWAEPPDYDAVNHQLVWSLAIGNKGATSDEPQSVNYNTHALGREGVLSLNLVTSRSALERHKPVAKSLLAALEFNPGKHYEDFNAATDNAAEYGLAALVGGAFVAKKLGLLAVAGLFLAKFGKIIAIAAAALFGLFGKRWGKKKGDDGGSLDA